MSFLVHLSSTEVGFLDIDVLILCKLDRLFWAMVILIRRIMSIPMVPFAAWDIATSPRTAYLDERQYINLCLAYV